MIPEGSLSYTQGAATDAHPEPDESSQTSNPISLRYILILYPRLRLGLAVY
jgi:hypothetical protein